MMDCSNFYVTAEEHADWRRRRAVQSPAAIPASLSKVQVRFDSGTSVLTEEPDD